MQNNRFRLVPFAEEHGEQICAWRYEPPYDLYNSDPWALMVQEQAEFADPAIREQQYRAVVDESGILCGFAQFFPLIGAGPDSNGVATKCDDPARAADTIRLGLGMRPDLCGQGLGLLFVQAIIAEAQRRAPGAEIDLEVLTWNTRAMRTYEKAGFVITDRYTRPTPSGPGEFYCMVYEGNRKPGSIS